MFKTQNKNSINIFKKRNSFYVDINTLNFLHLQYDQIVLAIRYQNDEKICGTHPMLGQCLCQP